MRSIGKWQGQDVTIVRPVKQGDEGFDPSLGIGEQVVIQLLDGSEKTVLRHDIETNPKTN
jgi:hypothetical protein